MEVADAELGPRHVDGQEDLAPAAQVLDIAVAAVLGAAGDRARALGANFVLERARRGACVHVLGLRRLGDDALEVGRADEVGLAAVPLGEDLRRGRAAEDARVDEAGEAQVGDVAGGAEDAFKVPDCFGAGMEGRLVVARGWSGWGLGDLRIRIDLVKETSPVVFVKDACEAPWLLLERLHILDLHHKNISRFGAFHLEGAR